MNTAFDTTVRDLIRASVRKGQYTAQSAYDLAHLSRRSMPWDEFLTRPVRIPAKSILECVRDDQRFSEDRGLPAADTAQLMRQCIRFCLKTHRTGSGNRARRRAAVIGMQSHNRAWEHLNVC